MANLRPSDNKREEFRKYLEKTGVMDALSKVLVSLYEETEKPVDALEYLRTKLSVGPDGATIESVQAELAEANKRIVELEAQLGQEGLAGAPPEAESGEGRAAPEAEEAPPEVTPQDRAQSIVSGRTQSIASKGQASVASKTSAGVTNGPRRPSGQGSAGQGSAAIPESIPEGSVQAEDAAIAEAPPPEGSVDSANKGGEANGSQQEVQ